jgi:hypothetical protein
MRIPTRGDEYIKLLKFTLYSDNGIMGVHGIDVKFVVAPATHFTFAVKVKIVNLDPRAGCVRADTAKKLAITVFT